MKRSMLFSIFGIVLLTSSCSENSATPVTVELNEAPVEQVALRQVNGCEDLKQRFVDNWVENLLSIQRFDDQVVVLQGTPVFEAAADGALSATSLATPPQTNPDNVSQTNVQEAGVDEADSVKAHSITGDLYIAQHDKLVIADAFPPDSMSILSTLDLGGFVSGIYLAETENIVAALVTPRIEFFAPGPMTDTLTAFTPWQSKTDLVLVDTSDVTNPVITRRIRLDGSLVSSRRVDSRVLLVQSYYLTPLFNRLDDDLRGLLQRYREAYRANDETLMQTLRADIRQRVLDTLPVDDAQNLLPSWQVLVNDVEESSDRLDCEAVFAPRIGLNHNELLTVTSIDLAGDGIQRIAAIGSGWITYASRNDLFVVQSGHSWWWDRDQLQQSAIHHFSIAGDTPAYLSTGLVKGFVNNSFSLSYHQDRLRVATTENRWNLSDRSDVRSTNHLYVLADNAAQGMDIVGSVENYADNERIFSARFLGDKGFVVTFRRIDPLFTFDLSDPTQPVIVGELLIPGFSTYMHPIDDDHLLTIGRDGNAAGATDQVAVKLFDVSDMANPREVHSLALGLPGGYSWSQANWDPHAFTYYAPEQMLSVPLSSFNAQRNDYFMGLVVLNVDIGSGLSLAGRVDHEDLLPPPDCTGSDPFCHRFFHRWLSQPTRSVFMTADTDSYLYSLSNIGIKSVNTSALDLTLDSLLLPSPRTFYEVYF